MDNLVIGINQLSGFIYNTVGEQREGWKCYTSSSGLKYCTQDIQYSSLTAMNWKATSVGGVTNAQGQTPETGMWWCSKTIMENFPTGFFEAILSVDANMVTYETASKNLIFNKNITQLPSKDFTGEFIFTVTDMDVGGNTPKPTDVLVSIIAIGL